MPYTLNAYGLLQLTDGSFGIDFSNTGTAAAVFHVRSTSSLHVPRSYTVEPGKSLSDSWAFTSQGIVDCDLSVYGPNGFFGEFKGSIPALRSAQLEVTAHYDTANNGVAVVIGNPSAQTANVNILDRYSGESTKSAVMPGHSITKYFSLARFGGWYA